MNKHHHHHHRDEMLRRLSILDFMLIDLGLYLNTNPEDARALAIHATVAGDAAKLRAAFEAEFGPLCARSQHASDQRWNWISDPWPWEAEANFQIT